MPLQAAAASGRQILQDKKTLRAQVRAYIKTLPEGYISASDAGIMANVLAADCFCRAATVFAYSSIGRECATGGIAAAALAMGKTVAMPRTRPGGEMDFASVEYGMHTAMYDIPEPVGSAPAIEPATGDIIIVPALCCDASGMRLGQGGGYYDRFLAKYPSVCSVCLCREKLIQEKIPAEWNDIRTDFVITEERIIDTRIK